MGPTALHGGNSQSDTLLDNPRCIGLCYRTHSLRFLVFLLLCDLATQIIDARYAADQNLADSRPLFRFVDNRHLEANASIS